MRPKRADELLVPDKRLLEACQALRYAVEHPNEDSDVILQQGVYKQRDPEAIMTIGVGGVEVGYKVKECSKLEMSPYFDRFVYVKVPGQHLNELSKRQLMEIHSAVMDAFFEVQQGEIYTECIAWDAFLLWQRFMVAFPVKVQDNFTVVGAQIQ